MIQAIIDIGSNTIRLAIYKIEYGKIELIMKRKNMVGLAAYIKADIMQPKGIDKACEILNEYKEFLNAFKIKEITAFTTAALRNVKNSKEAVQQITEVTGIAIRVISGDEEAVYDFIGATHDLKDDSGLLIDIGGASTEIVVYENHEICSKISLPIGSLALHTKYAEGFLPSCLEIEDMRQEIEGLLSAAPEFKDIQHMHICGIGGTFKGASALYNEIFQLGKENKSLQTEKLEEIIARFNRDSGMIEKDVLILMKTVPDRIQTIIPGLVIADVLAKHFGSEQIDYADAGVREGYLYDQIIGDAE